MDPLIADAARSLTAGNPLAALKRIALRDDAPALALRGIAMAQLGDLARARTLLGRAARAFGRAEPLARARCSVAIAEIALVSRDLGRPLQGMNAARGVLEAHGDLANAAHAGYLEARRLLLIGRLDEAAQVLDGLQVAALPVASRVGYELVAAGIAMRRIRTKPARSALDRAGRAAAESGIPALRAEVEHARQVLDAPAARLVARGEQRLLGLEEVEALLETRTIVVDACRTAVRAGVTTIPLANRPVLFSLLRVLGEAWPADAPRETLLARAFRAPGADESYRARLRVEVGRLREAIEPLAAVTATRRGFTLQPHAAWQIVVLAPPVETKHADVLALLADGEAWSSSALAQALDVSPRTVLRALDTLAGDALVAAVGQGRARRWIAAHVPGFPTSLLLPGSDIAG